VVFLAFVVGMGLGSVPFGGNLMQSGVQSITICPWDTHKDVNMDFPGEHAGSWVKKPRGDCHVWYHVTN